MKKQNLINFSVFAIILFTISCTQKNSALRIKADQENAKVIIDGEEVGTAPLDVMVSAGKHIIEVFVETSDGRFCDARQIEIGDNVAKSESFKLFLNAGYFIDSRDNHFYKTIKIGSQIWMAENLGYQADSGCWAYNNDESNVAKYGRLYTWKIAKNVCPAGWHLPSDAEWSTLTNYLGGEDIASGKMKVTTDWEYDAYGNATNESGFNALPAGGRNYADGSFYAIVGFAFFWSSTPTEGEYVWGRRLSFLEGRCYRGGYNRSLGFSVRCLKD